jgi:nucleoside-diphosphate-sugar epimerase
MSAILVFGGTGFIGSALVKSLLSKNLIVLVFRHRNKGFLCKVKNDNLVYFESFDDPILRKYNIDSLYHLASKLPDIKPAYNDFYDANVTLTLKIVNLSKKLNIKQFIYSSTGSLFTEPSKPTIFNEDTPPNPLNYYGLTKYISERLLAIEFKDCNTQVSIVRFPSIFGKNDSTGIVNLFFDLAVNGLDIEVFSNGVKYRSLIYIDSAIDVLYKIYKCRGQLSKYEIFSVGSSDSATILNIAETIVGLVNSDSKIIPVDKFSPSDFDVHIDVSKAKKLLGFKPISIESGLKKYVEERKHEET